MSRKAVLLPIITLALITPVALIAIDSRVTKERETSNDQQDLSATEQELVAPAIINLFTLSDDGYHQLYESLRLPNTVEQTKPPVITGDKTADEHIRELAEKRGFVLQQIARDEAELDPEEGLQALAAADWRKLQAKGKKAGVELRLVSGYRSVHRQRVLFLDELARWGVKTAVIKTGTHDVGLSEALSRVAPPGYSRHHNGYTLDLASSDHPRFVSSAGYRWLSADNFKQARRHGFIPSYPEGADSQGPEPEPWEFIWLGSELIGSQKLP